MNNNPQTRKDTNDPDGIIGAIYEICEMIGIVSIVVMILFAFVTRISIVTGESMEQTLFQDDYLVISDLFYEPSQGDIVIIHKIDAMPYSEPIVKRVIAVAGDKVDIDSATGTVYVNDKPITEDYAYFDPTHPPIYPEYDMPIIVPENEVFVLGDNRDHSGDSRQIELGTIDERCIVGKAIARIFPLQEVTFFK